MSDEYTQLEADLSALLHKDTFSDGEAASVRRFLDAGEYGLALETLCSIVREEQKVVSRDFRSRIVEVAERMGIKPEI